MTPIEIGLGAVVAVMGGGNVWNWLASRGKAKVDLIQLSEQIADRTIKALDQRIKELEEKVDTLSAHVETLESVIRGLGATPPPRPVRRKPE